MALEKLSLSSEQVTKGNNVSEFNFLLRCMPANNYVFWENVPFWNLGTLNVVPINYALNYSFSSTQISELSQLHNEGARASSGAVKKTQDGFHNCHFDFFLMPSYPLCAPGSGSQMKKENNTTIIILP